MPTLKSLIYHVYFDFYGNNQYFSFSFILRCCCFYTKKTIWLKMNGRKSAIKVMWTKVKMFNEKLKFIGLETNNVCALYIIFLSLEMFFFGFSLICVLIYAKPFRLLSLPHTDDTVGRVYFSCQPQRKQWLLMKLYWNHLRLSQVRNVSFMANASRNESFMNP